MSDRMSSMNACGRLVKSANNNAADTQPAIIGTERIAEMDISLEELQLAPDPVSRRLLPVPARADHWAAVKSGYLARHGYGDPRTVP